jgi:predicted TIM-barrel fold metal-dependent hydrolase
MLATIDVVDMDAHVIEPPDLWTSRLSAKYRDEAPRVEVNPADGHHRWLIPSTGRWLTPVGYYAWAGWREPPPSHPHSFDEIDASQWEPTQRLAYMDTHKLFAQVLYPNLIGFETYHFMAHSDPRFALECTRAYNDFLAEFISVDPKRLIGIGMVPFWDRDAAIAEIKRIKEIGHKGLLMANRYEMIDLPGFTQEYWDPVYATAQELDLPINFHIGFSSAKDNTMAQRFDQKVALGNEARESTLWVSLGVMRNSEPIAQIVTSGLCDRFPELKFVSVESGFGYLPYLMDALDYHWKVFDGHRLNPGSLLPSEYFKRQCYGSFWFEKSTLSMLPHYADNIMFETDFPHPTSLSPGSEFGVDDLSVFIADSFADVPDELARKVLHDNAAAVYGIED